MKQAVEVSAESLHDFDDRGRSRSFRLPSGDYTNKPGEIQARVDGKPVKRRGTLSRVSGKRNKWVLKRST